MPTKYIDQVMIVAFHPAAGAASPGELNERLAMGWELYGSPFGVDGFVCQLIKKKVGVTEK